MQPGLGLCFVPTQLLMGGSQKNGAPTLTCTLLHLCSPLARKTFFHSRDQIRSQKACSFPDPTPQLLGCCVTPPVRLMPPSGQSRGGQSLSRFRPPCPLWPPQHPAHTRPKGLPPCRALYALAGLPSASAMLDVGVNTHPRVKGTAHPLQGHQAKAKNPPLGVRVQQRHGHLQPHLCDFRKVAQPLWASVI